MNPAEKPKNPLSAVGGIVGAVIGFYCGFMLLIPIAACAIAIFALKQVSLPRLEAYKFGVGVIIGHTAWMSFGLLAPGATVLMILPDLVLALIGLIWLCVQPGKWPVWYFLIFEGVSVVINAVSLLGQSFGSVPHKALVAHLALRIFIMAALWSGLKKQSAAPPPLPQAGVV